MGADILAALKFTSVEEKFNYGLFSAIEDSDDVAEGRNFYAGRIVRKTDDYSIGYMLTYADRPDIERDAIVQTIDYSYNFGQYVQINGQVINTNISLPLHNTSDNGAWVSVQHQITDTWNQFMQVSYYGDEFDVNDLGFLGRNNLRTFDYYSGWENYSFAEDSILQSHNYSIGFYHEENNQGDHLRSIISLGNNWTFKNTSNANVNLNYTTAGSNDIITRGNGNLNTDSGFSVNVIYFADRRNKFQWHLRGNIFDNFISARGYRVHFHPSYQFDQVKETNWG